MASTNADDVELTLTAPTSKEIVRSSKEEEFNRKWKLNTANSNELLNDNLTSRPPKERDYIYAESFPPEALRLKVLHTQENSQSHHNLPWILQSDAYEGGLRWMVLAAAFLTLFLFSVTLSGSLYTSSLETEFNVNRSDSSNFTSLEFGLFCAFSVFVARLVDIFGVLPVLYFSLFCITLGQFIASFLDDFWSVTVAYAILCGIGASGTQMLGMIMCNDWFAPMGKTGFSTGFALSAVGLGGICWTYFFQYLLDNFGWRICFRYSALFSLCLSILIIALARTRTLTVFRTKDIVVDGVNSNIREQLGDDTDVAVTATDLYGPPPPLLYLSPLAKPRFLLFLFIVLMATFIFYAPYVHIIPSAMDQGLSPSDASFVLILAGITTMVGRPILGVMADRVGGLYVMLLANICQFLFCLFWLYSTEKWHFYMLGLFMGFSVSAYIMGCSTGFMSPSALVEPHEISSAFGYVFGVAYTPGATAVGTLFGNVYDNEGSYDSILIAFSVIQAIAVILNVVILLPIWAPLVKPDPVAEAEAAKEAAIAEAEAAAKAAAIAAALEADGHVEAAAGVDVDDMNAPKPAPRGDQSQVWVYPHAIYRFLRQHANAAIAKHTGKTTAPLPEPVHVAVDVAGAAADDASPASDADTKQADQLLDAPLKHTSSGLPSTPAAVDAEKVDEEAEPIAVYADADAEAVEANSE